MIMLLNKMVARSLKKGGIHEKWKGGREWSEGHFVAQKILIPLAMCLNVGCT